MFPFSQLLSYPPLLPSHPQHYSLSLFLSLSLPLLQNKQTKTDKTNRQKTNKTKNGKTKLKSKKHKTKPNKTKKPNMEFVLHWPTTLGPGGLPWSVVDIPSETLLKKTDFSHC